MPSGDEEVSHVGSTIEHGRSSRLDTQRLRALLRSPDGRTDKRAHRHPPLVRSPDLVAAGQRPLADASRGRIRPRPAHVRNRQPGRRTAAAITSAAGPFIHELTERTGQVVHLAVLDQQDVVYLDKVASAFADRAFADTLPSRVGGRLPAHCTAVGKALLAYSPLATVSEYLATGLRGGRMRAWRRRPPSRRRSSASATRGTRPTGTRRCPVSPASPPRSATSTKSSPRSRSAGLVTRCARRICRRWSCGPRPRSRGA